jgi:hypothetical protein
VAQVDDRSSPFGDSANLMQDRFTVCAERIIGSKSFWTHPMDLLSDISHVESHFNLFGDRGSVSAREVHGLLQT